MTEAEWSNSTLIEHMLTSMDQVISDRQRRLLACAACRHVWDSFPDDTCRRAIEIAEQLADGQTTQGAMYDASEQVSAAISAYLSLVGSRTNDPTHRILLAAFWVAPQTHQDTRSCLAACLSYLRPLRSRAPLDSANAPWQTQLLRDIVGNPFRPIKRLHRLFGEGEPDQAPGVLDTCFLTPDVRTLAQAAYDCRPDNGMLFPDQLAVLADALEEAGCTNEVLLMHLRGQEPCVGCEVERKTGEGTTVFQIAGVFVQAGNTPTTQVHLPGCRRCQGTGWRRLHAPHYRGCWAVDLCCAKE